MVHRVHKPGYLPSNAEQAITQNADPAYHYRADQVLDAAVWRRRHQDALYDLIVELLVRNEAVNAWAIEHGGSQLPPIKALGCSCQVHAAIRRRVREIMKKRRPASTPKAGA